MKKLVTFFAAFFLLFFAGTTYAPTSQAKALGFDFGFFGTPHTVTPTPSPTPPPAKKATPLGLLLSHIDITVQMHTPSSLPENVDLSAHNPPIISQGNTASCVSWATSYFLRGWYAKRDGYYPDSPDGKGGFAPMYTYAQAKYPSKSCQAQTDVTQTLQILKDQGVDTRAHFFQGDYACNARVTYAERANAAQYKIKDYTVLFNGGGNNSFIPWVNKKMTIESTLAGGNPLVLLVKVPHAINHEVFVYGYDQAGVKVLSSSKLVGNTLSWQYVSSQAIFAATIDPDTTTTSYE